MTEAMFIREAPGPVSIGRQGGLHADGTGGGPVATAGGDIEVRTATGPEPAVCGRTG